jgi:hypothetical protein
MKKGPTPPARKLPLVFLHIHLTAVTPTRAAALVPLRDAIERLVQDYADQYGLRIKRRVIPADAGAALWSTYEDRAKVFSLID